MARVPKSTDSFVCTLDLQGRFTSIDAAGETITGYSAKELLGRFATEILDPAVRKDAAVRFQQRLDGATDTSETVLVRRTGERVPISVTSTMIERDGVPTGVLGIVQDLGERARVANALQESEQRFRGAFDSAAIGMALVALDGRFIDVNRSLCDLLGYDAEQLTGRTFQELTHPDDLDLDLDYVRRMLAGEIASYQMEKRYVHATGRDVWAQLSVSLVRTPDGEPLYFVSQIADVDTRRRALDALERGEAQLRDAERRYRTLVEQLPLVMYVRPLSMDEPSIYVSPQVEEMLGYPAEEWLRDANLLTRIVHPDDRERVIAEGTRVRAGGAPVDDEYRYVKPDGSVVWVRDRTHLVRDANGEPSYVQGFLQDITARRAAEAERDRLRDELLHAQKLEALGRLAGGVAHDFNNMLTAITGYAELLIARLDPRSPAREDARKILHAAEQAAGLPRHLLAFGRKQMLDPALVDLNALVESTGALLEHVISGSITVEIVPGAAEAWTIADRSQLEHALVNLALNASDAMPVGGVLKVATDNVTMTDSDVTDPETRPGRYVVLRVSDTGIGMDAATRRRAFEPFFTTKQDAQGSGLGLSSVYGTVAQSGGFVHVESAPGEGTTFSLHLPVATSPTPSRRARAVLLAEDEEIVRDLTEQILSDAGFRVITAVDGAEALALYHRHRADIAVVVTDIVMPNLSGRGLARQIREVDTDVPIVFMSGHHEETAETLQLNAGATLLQKPFTLASIVEAVERLVQQEEGEHDEPAIPSLSLPTLTCVVVDDHPAVLDAVSRYLETRRIRVAQARDGEEGIATINAIAPDVAVVDVAMSPLGGIEVARRVQASSPSTRVVLYTGHNDRALLDEALDAGIRGFVLKEAPLAALEEAVRTVGAGGTWVDPSLAQVVASPATVSALPPLTPREREVLVLVADGLTNEKVAATLDISPETVQSHVRHAMVKLEADTRTEAVATALRHALIA